MVIVCLLYGCNVGRGGGCLMRASGPLFRAATGDLGNEPLGRKHVEGLPDAPTLAQSVNFEQK
jgi:hypothetical protein